MSNATAVPLQPVKRGYLVWLWVGLLAALLAAFLVARRGDDFLTRNARAAGVTTTASGLQYKVLDPGPGGARPTDSDVVLINYEGRLTSGAVFDRSERPTPLPVTGVVPGFSEGLKLMARGSRYRFWIKPELGYGAKGPLPPNSTLIFDVELVDFIPAAVLRQQMQAGAPLGQGPAPR